MKATIDIPDDLYRRVKAKSALEGRPIRAVAIELFQSWLDQQPDVAQQRDSHDFALPDPDAPTPRSSAQQWLDEWLQLGQELFKDAPPGPTAREILEAGRNRLERR